MGRSSSRPRGSVLERIDQHRQNVDAVGPGLGQSDEIRQLVKFLITSATKPLVIDADGLNALVDQIDLLTGLTHPVVLTPHPGEFARLIGGKVADVQSDRITQSAKMAKRSQSLVVVLKGAATVVTDGPLAEHQYDRQSRNGDRGGTGDVLTGVIAALLAQKLALFERRPSLGYSSTGSPATSPVTRTARIGMIAGDLVDALLLDAFVHAMPDPDVDSLSASR